MIRNLFWRKLLGGIPSTDKAEKDILAHVEWMKRLEQTAHSPELAEFNRLHLEVTSSAFLDKKKKIQNSRYKDTQEYEQHTRFHKLENDKGIRHYFDTLDSKELAQYLAFRNSPEAGDLNDKGKISITPHLKNLKDFENSKTFKNFMRFHNSYIIKEYLELKEIVESEDFKNRNAYWSNPKRWETTLEFITESRYKELSSNPDIQAFVKSLPKNSRSLKKIAVKLEEDFRWKKMEDSLWTPGFTYPSEKLISNHSFHNEQQANSLGKNVTVSNEGLQINTKKESASHMTWHPEKGFIQKKFNYTGDVINTGSNYRIHNGEIKIKLRCKGNIHHAFWLGADHMKPHINIFHYDGKYIRFESYTDSNRDSVAFKGMDCGQYLIYGLKWTEKELIWSINNVPLYRSTNAVPDEEMYLSLNSFIPEGSPADEGALQVQWIKIFQEEPIVS